MHGRNNSCRHLSSVLLPSFPTWASALIALLVLTLVNLAAAKLFGEPEFWFALVKVVTIIVMIVVDGKFSAIIMVTFAFLGMEPIGVTAGEAKDPEKNSKLGIAAAACIINFVVLTAASSSCNSDIYTTGSILHSLALQGKAPKSLATLSKSGVPARGIFCSVACMLIGFVLNYLAPGKAFSTVTSIATLLCHSLQ